MNTNTTPRTIDVSGLPDEAIYVVESLVSLLRGKPPEPKPAFASHEEWLKAFNEWLASHSPRGTDADFSRESIYAGRGE
jgi:hypothetical protein